MKKFIGFICLVFMLVGSASAGTVIQNWNDSNKAHAASDTTSIKKVAFNLIYTSEDGYPIRDESTALYSKNNTTLIPVRMVSESLDCNVHYNNQTNEIIINNKYPELTLKNSWILKKHGVDLSRPNKDIELKLNSKTAIVNGKQINLAIAPTLINGVTYVPTRFVSEGLGYYVYFDEDLHGDYNIYIEQTPLLEIEEELKMIKQGNFNREVYISDFIGYELLNGKHTAKGIKIGSTMEQVINAYGLGQSHNYDEYEGPSFKYFSRGYIPSSGELYTLNVNFNEAGIVTAVSIWEP